MLFRSIIGEQNAHQLLLGFGLAMVLFFIGAGAVQWAKTLMPDHEEIDERKPMRSKDDDRNAFVETVRERAAETGIARRPLIKRTLALALGLVGVSPILLLRDLGPLPKNSLEKTSWTKGTYLVTDPGDRKIKAAEIGRAHV